MSMMGISAPSAPATPSQPQATTTTKVVDLSHKAVTLEGTRAKKVTVSQEIIAKAIRRLMLDLQEIQNNPLETVCAKPLDSDFFEWHCNMKGQADSEYSGITFHLIFIFPQTYPVDSPKLFNCSYISHQHVFGSWICLDLLEEAQWSSSEETNKPYTGWSSAYSVQSILLQLQAFLFDKASKDRVEIEKASKSAQQFHCANCGHKHGAESPQFSVVKPQPKLALPTISVPNRIVRVVNGREFIQKRALKTRSPVIAQPQPQAIAAPARAWGAPATPVAPIIPPAPVENNAVPVSSPVDPKDAWKSTPRAIFTPPKNYKAPANVFAVPAKIAAPVPASLPPQSQQRPSKRQPAKAQPVRAQVAPAKAAVQAKPKLVISQSALQSGLTYSQAAAMRNRQPSPKIAAPSPLVAKPAPQIAAPAIVAPQPAVVSPFDVKLPEPKPQKAEVSPAKAPVAKLIAKRISGSVDTEIKNAGDAAGIEASFFSFLVDELIVDIFSYLTPKELGVIGAVCKQFFRIGGDKRLWKYLFAQYYPGTSFEARSISGWKHVFAQEKAHLMSGLICFHTKVSFKDAVLGIPINYSTNPRTNVIDKIDSTLDLISHEAYEEDGVRKSVWKEPFKLWMPLFICPDHVERALPLLENSLAQLCKERKFRPDMALEVLPKLMNTMVVSLMKGDLHASIVALEGYCAFHRLLLFFVKEYPELQRKINAMAISFCNSESKRTKDVVPALGEFLPLLTVSDKVSWQKVCMPYLQENFDRNALWTIKKYPGMAYVNDESPAASTDRLNKTFDATQVSIKLLMFHVYFFKNVARPEGISLDQVAANYDAFYGRPSSQMKEDLQRKCKEILGVQNWSQFFRGIGMAPPPPTELAKWLRRSVKNSLQKGYHSNGRRN
eukprot:TRINITY_DN4309_c0_g1_i1.p1 TRINITY_DN4309_c0_g1~~TRINITY_DN4309_c0_g1_i1.p1  ORF type:complete len:1000 (-),score=330.36 TRINITY_DN4309_c0_g1_i1:12-2684(-)